MKLSRFAWVVLMLLYAGLPRPAAALDSHFPMTDYRHDVWGAKEGAPSMVLAMAQTRDGWLWLGTYRGLYRFDGVSFERFEPLPGEALLYNGISTMTAAPNGDLLIAYLSGGLSVLHEGHLRHLTSLAKQPFSSTFAVLADVDGSYWAGAINGLFHLSGNAWEKIGPGWDFHGVGADNMVLDQHGRLFVSDGRQVLMLDREHKKFRHIADGGNGPDLVSAPDGTLWMDLGGRMRRIDAPLPDGVAVLPRAADAASATNAMATLFDRDGNLWMRCPQRLCLVKRAALPDAAAFERAGLPAEHLSDPPPARPALHGMLEDRDGAIWLATNTGVERFRQNRLAKIALPPETWRVALGQSPRGELLLTLGFPPHLFRVDGDVVKPATAHLDAGLLRRGIGDTLLLATPTALVVQEQGGERSIPYPAEASPTLPLRLLQEGPDAFWIGWSARPTLRYAHGRWSHADPRDADQQQGAGASRGDGHVWLGYPDNRVVDFSEAGSREYGAGDGVDVRVATFIDVQREVLIAGDGGLEVLAGARFRHVRALDADILTGISGLVIGADGDRWFNCARGVLHVTAAAWQAAMRDAAAPLRYELLDQLDGFPGSPQVSNVASAAATPDGRLWFASSEGLALYDPRHDRRAPAAPAPAIRALRAGGRRYDPFETIRLAPGTTRVALEFTALGNPVPERVRYRYRLQGVERDWQGPWMRRDLSYANLEPGSYTFALQAAGADGAWSTQTATVRFEILPRFTQTSWFKLLCVLLALGVLALGHRLRLRQVTARLLALHRERERIARTLHDTFLQSLQALVWRFDGIRDSLPADTDSRKQIDRTLAQAEEVMEEGRRQIQDLRPAGRGQPLEARLDGLLASLRPRFAMPIHVEVRRMAPARLVQLVADESFHIAHEAMLNALQHGRLTALNVRLDYADTGFTLAVADDGGGIDAAILASGGREGHWGLAGMRERARAIGAALAIDSVAGRGTVVTLQVPRRAAYERTRFAWLRRR